jgi:hypothetical protein
MEGLLIEMSIVELLLDKGIITSDEIQNHIAAFKATAEGQKIFEELNKAQKGITKMQKLQEEIDKFFKMFSAEAEQDRS